MRLHTRVSKSLFTALVVITAVSTLLLPHLASAQRLFPSIVPSCDQTLEFTGGNTYQTNRQCDFSDFIQLFVNLFDWGLAVLSILSITFFIIGGLLLLLSGGNENRVKSGKAILTNTVLGIAIVLCSWLIINSVIGFLVGSGNLKDVQVFGKLWWGVPTCASKYSDACSKNNLHLGCGDTKTTYVSELQRKLNAANGCQEISIDGCFGPETEKAVQAFNVAAIFSPNNEAAKMVTSETWAALNAGKSCIAEQHTALPRAATGGETGGCCITSCATQGIENTVQSAGDGQGCLNLIPDAKWYSGACHMPISQIADGCCVSVATGTCYDNSNKEWCDGSYWSGQSCASMESRCAIINQCE